MLLLLLLLLQPLLVTCSQDNVSLCLGRQYGKLHSCGIFPCLLLGKILSQTRVITRLVAYLTPIMRRLLQTYSVLSPVCNLCILFLSIYFTGSSRQAAVPSCGQSTSSAASAPLAQGGATTQVPHSHGESSRTLSESCYNNIPLLIIITHPTVCISEDTLPQNVPRFLVCDNESHRIWFEVGS